MGQTSMVAKHFLVMLPIMFRRQVFFCFIIALLSPLLRFILGMDRAGGKIGYRVQSLCFTSNITASWIKVSIRSLYK